MHADSFEVLVLVEKYHEFLMSDKIFKKKIARGSCFRSFEMGEQKSVSVL